MKKLHVILDLDETLVSSQRMDELDAADMASMKAKLKWHDIDGYYIAFERPHLQEFLDELFKTYKVSVWSAGSKDYVLEIIEKVVLVKKQRVLEYIFFSYHCKLSKQRYSGQPKNLCLLWDTFKIHKFRSSNTLIIDDHHDVQSCQPSNCIQIKEFDVLDPNSFKDNELVRIIHDLQTHTF